MKQKHIEISVSGKVQGVWFRKHTEIEANRLGLYGYVKNCSDGSVFIEVKGNEAAVKQLLNWCSLGSPKSKVLDVKHKICETPKEFSAFRIER